MLLNVPALTAISWENGTRKPSGAALRLLAVARHHPESAACGVAAFFSSLLLEAATTCPQLCVESTCVSLYAGTERSCFGLRQSEHFAKLEAISTLHEIKVAAATLPAEERSELATWLSESDDVSKIRHQQLRREIRIGLDEIERGEAAPLDIAEVKRKARAQWETERQG